MFHFGFWNTCAVKTTLSVNSFMLSFSFKTFGIVEGKWVYYWHFLKKGYPIKGLGLFLNKLVTAWDASFMILVSNFIF
jgi:hypothetical protein